METSKAGKRLVAYVLTETSELEESLGKKWALIRKACHVCLLGSLSDHTAGAVYHVIYVEGIVTFKCDLLTLDCSIPNNSCHL